VSSGLCATGHGVRGLGANLGDAAAAVLQAIEDIGRIEGVRLLRRSSLYRTGRSIPAGLITSMRSSR